MTPLANTGRPLTYLMCLIIDQSIVLSLWLATYSAKADWLWEAPIVFSFWDLYIAKLVRSRCAGSWNLILTSLSRLPSNYVSVVRHMAL